MDIDKMWVMVRNLPQSARKHGILLWRLLSVDLEVTVANYCTGCCILIFYFIWLLKNLVG